MEVNGDGENISEECLHKKEEFLEKILIRDFCGTRSQRRKLVSLLLKNRKLFKKSLNGSRNNLKEVRHALKDGDKELK